MTLQPLPKENNLKNLKTKIAEKISMGSAIMLVIIPMIMVVSCIDTYNNEIGGLEQEIREVNRSVQSQMYICDGIEEPVYYRGRKIYNGCHTRYYKYQSTTTGQMYKPKRKPVCQELGERPFTGENLERIAQLKSERYKEGDDLWYRNLWFICLWIFFLGFNFYLHRGGRKQPRL